MDGGIGWMEGLDGWRDWIDRGIGWMVGSDGWRD